MSIGPPKRSSGGTSVGTFIRRLLWRREIGPLRAMGRIEVREMETGSDGRDPSP